MVKITDGGAFAPDDIDISRQLCLECPDNLRKSILHLPASLIDELRLNIDALEYPWGAAQPPRACSAEIGHIRNLVTEALDAQSGLAILTGDGMSDLSDNVLAGFHLSIAKAIGKPVGQNGANETLVEVRASCTPGTLSSRGFQDSDSMLLHSDAADVSGLMCLSQASAGGTSLFASAIDIHDILSREAPRLLPLYFRHWYWNVGVLGFPGVESPIKLPIFSVHRGQLSCRYSPSLLREGAIAAGEPLSTAQISALDLFEEVALRDGVVARYRLTRGESVWMNNQTLLHGRDAFSDSADQTRRMLRAWSRSTTARQRWPLVAKFDDHLFHGL